MKFKINLTVMKKLGGGIESYIIIAIICLLSIFRIYIGNSFPYWYSLISGQLDELLLIDYAHLGQHFANWNMHSLSKTIGYSIFLKFVNVTGLPYGLVFSILWIFAGIFVIYAVYKYITKNKLVLALIYLFIIFFPNGLDLFISGRIYRNAIIAPFLILFLSSLIIFMNKLFDESKSYSLLIWGIITGLLFTFNYYIKEEGIAILFILIAVICVALIFKFMKTYKNKNFDLKKSVKFIFLCIIPILIFVGGSFTYSEINHEKFGVYDINTRTEGELGEFFYNLLLIDDSNKSDLVWVPYSTIEKAWAASPTLEKHPELLNNWAHSEWAQGDLKKNNVAGDLIAWSLRDALALSGLYNDEKSTSDFFHTINGELDVAFKNGDLNKSDKIFISKYARGRSLDEIYVLNYLFFQLLQTSTLYSDLGKNIHEDDFDSLFPTLTCAERNNVSDVESFLNMHLLTKNEFSQDNFSLNFATIDIHFYQLISYVLVFISLAGFILTGINAFSTNLNKIWLLFIFEILLLITLFAQLFGTCWFCSFLGYGLYIRAYTSGCQAIFALFEVLTISELFIILKEKYLE